MKKAKIRKYCMRLMALALVGVLAVLLSMNKSEAAPSGKGVGNITDLQKAIAAGEENIYLTADITYGSKYIILQFNSGKNVTLDLNGHDIIMNNSPRRCYFNVSSGTTLTICDTSSTDGDKQGRIRHGGGFFGGGVRVDGEGTKLILESGGISECEATCGGAVAVLDGASFEMNGGYIELSRTYGQSKNNESAGNGNGVYVAEGTFTMNGGCIRGNNAGNTESHNGGAVWVGENAVFTMNGGKIGDRQILSSKYYGTQGGGNISQGNGGAIYVGGGECYLNSGEIDSNTASGKLGGGAVFIGEGSTFEIKREVQLLANRANENGGAIYIDRPKSCVINGVTIDGGTSGANATRGGAIYVSSDTTQDITVKDVVMKRLTSADGGAVYSEGGKLNLSNVTMSNCSSSGNGGAMHLAGKAVVVVKNGTITDNDAINGDINKFNGLGGAICLKDESNCLLENTVVSNNKANNGGGIYVSKDTTLTVDGGSITGNEAVKDFYYAIVTAGGIWDAGNLIFSGTPVIKDNIQSNHNADKYPKSDVYLTYDNNAKDTVHINAGSELKEGAEIGILTEVGSSRDYINTDTIRITDNYKNINWKTAPEKYFFSDDSSYYVQKNPNLDSNTAFYHEAFLMKEKHDHSNNYTYVDRVIPNCVSVGHNDYYECLECHRIFIDYEFAIETNDEERFLDKDPYNHKGPEVESDWTADKTALCMEGGIDKRNITCGACHEVIRAEYMDTSPAGHKWEDYSETYDDNGATKTKTGWKCKVCGLIIWGNNPECEHDSIVNRFGFQSTCKSHGNQPYSICEECGTYFKFGTNELMSKEEVNDIVLPLAEHTYMAGTGPSTIKEATCTEDGYNIYSKTCSICGFVESTRTENIPAHHNWAVTPDTDKCLITRFCNSCGLEEVIDYNHNLIEVPYVAPSCVLDGHEAYYECLKCGGRFKENIDDEEDEITEEEYNSLVISEEDFEADYILPATGHKPGEAVMENVIDPDCNTDGSYEEVIYCSVCDREISREEKVLDKVTISAVGDGQIWTLGDSGNLEFVFKRSYKDEDTFDEWFTGVVKVDDEELDDSDFTAEKGSVDLKLNDSFLNTLEVGKHVVTVVFEDAESSADFNVVEPEEEEASEDKKDETTPSDDEQTSNEEDSTTDGKKPADDKTVDNTGDSTEKVTEDPGKDAVIEEKTEGNSTDKTDSTAKTGDETPVALFGILVAVSAAAIFCTVMKKKHDGRDE